MIQIELSDGEREAIERPVNGEGGFQSFLRRLQGQLVGNTLTISEEDVRRAIRYSTSYGQGGFEDRLGPIAEAGADGV